MFLSRRLTLTAIALLPLAGCAFTPQQTQIAVTTEIPKSEIGQGHTIYLQVVDERTSTEIGRRGTGAMQGAAITTTQDVAAVFRDAVVNGLTAKSFAIAADAAGASRHLRVDIRLLEYETSMGFWTGGVHTRAALKATVTDGGAAQYDNLYREEAERRVVFVPGAGRNEVQINEVAGGVVEKMFADTALLEALARAP